MADIVSWLSSDNGLYVHAGVFILLVLGGMGFPIPEDIPLLLGGVSVAKEIAPLETMFFTCYAGVILGDQIMFLIGHFYGSKLLSAGSKSRMFPGITEEKIEEIRDGLRKRRLLYIFIGRHLFPIRSATFVCAGALHIPFLEFFVADALAALVSCSIMVSLGYWLGGSLTPENVNHFVHQAHVYIIGIAVVCAAFLLLRYVLKKKRKKQTPAT